LKADATAEEIRHELEQSVRIAYMQVIAAERKKSNAVQQKELAERIERQVARLNKAGGETKAQLSKARVMQEQVLLEIAQADADIRTARQALAMLTGKGQVQEPVTASVFDALPVYEAPADAQPVNAPLLRTARLNRESAAAELAVQRSQRFGLDPTVGVGVRQFRDSKDNALVLNLSVPIPLLNRNRGGVIQAGAALAAAEAEQVQAERRYQSDVVRLNEALQKAKITADALSASVVPAMETAQEDMIQGYSAGRNSLLDVQDINRSLHDARTQLADARLTYHLTLAELKHFTANHDDDQPSVVEHTPALVSASVALPVSETSTPNSGDIQ
jgi:cobalt-zinc-cadmium efflux system outer membrane protein